MLYERTWEENQIVKTYKWANGFTKVKMNKLQKKFGNGYSWGMIYMFAMIIPHMLIGASLGGEDGEAVSCFMCFAICGIIAIYCSFQRDKVTYNEMIDRESQLNFFRDFNIPLKKIN